MGVGEVSIASASADLMVMTGFPEPERAEEGLGFVGEAGLVAVKVWVVGCGEERRLLECVLKQGASRSLIVRTIYVSRGEMVLDRAVKQGTNRCSDGVRCYKGSKRVCIGLSDSEHLNSIDKVALPGPSNDFTTLNSASLNHSVIVPA
jgi:hypothetical protein